MMQQYETSNKKVFKVLVVEDDLDTIRGTIKEIEFFFSVNAEVVTTLHSARKRLLDSSFDFLIVDARLPEKTGGELKAEGGVYLMNDLIDGKIGIKNIKTKFIILSAQATSLQKEGLKQYPTCVGIYSKLTPQEVIELFEKLIREY